MAASAWAKSGGFSSGRLPSEWRPLRRENVVGGRGRSGGRGGALIRRDGSS